MSAIGAQIAANQITKGGPVILVQTENEYSGFQAPFTEDFVYENDLKSILVAAPTYLLISILTTSIHSVQVESLSLLP